MQIKNKMQKSLLLSLIGLAMPVISAPLRELPALSPNSDAANKLYSSAYIYYGANNEKGKAILRYGHHELSAIMILLMDNKFFTEDENFSNEKKTVLRLGNRMVILEKKEEISHSKTKIRLIYLEKNKLILDKEIIINYFEEPENGI